MNKLVYLYELDSVNTSKEEIEYAQCCMYEEILYHGNQVVLTFNQLTDSKVFLEVIYNETSFNSIVELFRIGALKVSCYKQGDEEISTASQYVQHCIAKSLESSDTFLFSSLPMESSDKGLLKAIAKSLRYSNLGFLREYTKDTVGNEGKEKSQFIERFTELILEISRYENVYIQSRESTEINLQDCIQYIINNDESVESINSRDMKEAKSILRMLGGEIDSKNVNSRSVWHNKLATGARSASSVESWKIAELLVDVSYNYVVENSIKGVSKGANTSGIFGGILDRIEYQYKCWEMNSHVPLKGDSDQLQCVGRVKLPEWALVLRVLRNITGYNQNKSLYKGVSYSYKFYKELTIWRAKKFYAYLKNLLYIALLVLVAKGVEVILSNIEGVIDKYGMESLLQVILLLSITTILKNIIQRFVEIPDYSDSFQRVIITVIDGVRVLFGRKKVGYFYAIK